MSDQSRSVVLINPQQAKAALEPVWAWVKAMTFAGHRLHLTVRRETRSTSQNRLLWSCLRDISQQVDWMVDGRMVKLADEEWKDILTAGLKKTQRVAAGIEGGFVMLGDRTSKMTVKQMVDLIELAHAFGADKGVRWSRTSLGRDVPDDVFEEQE